MPKRTRLSWDYLAAVPLKEVPEWLKGGGPHPDARRPPFTVLDMLLVLGEVQRIIGYEITWDSCYEGGITLKAESFRFFQQHVHRGGHCVEATMRFTTYYSGDAAQDETQKEAKAWVGQILGLFNALARKTHPRPPTISLPGDGPTCGPWRNWYGPGVDAPALLESKTNVWDILLFTTNEGYQGPEELARRHHTTVEKLERILRTEFVLGFKVGLAYAWSVESFGVLEAVIKRRLRVISWERNLALHKAGERSLPE